MGEQALAVPVEANQALLTLQRTFGDALLAVYLHGSAVAGGLRPRSDVDLLAVIDRRTTRTERRQLMAELMEISGNPAGESGRRPVELVVLHRADLSASTYPARSEFVYGEWLRDAFEAGAVPDPSSDPEFTLLLAQARQEAIPLLGPPPSELLPVVPDRDRCRAIADALPTLMDTLDGDERNVLLTLARMWRTLVTGEFVPKDVAAEWAAARLPTGPATVVDAARSDYLAATGVDWRTRRADVGRTAKCLRERILALL